MAWLYLAIAIAAEVLATSLLKSTVGFTRLWPSVACLAGYGVSFLLLSLALRQLQVSITYAIWSGLGTAAIAVIGALFLDEPLTAVKLTGLVLIIAGVVVLNLSGAH